MGSLVGQAIAAARPDTSDENSIANYLGDKVCKELLA